MRSSMQEPSMHAFGRLAKVQALTQTSSDVGMLRFTMTKILILLLVATRTTSCALLDPQDHCAEVARTTISTPWRRSRAPNARLLGFALPLFLALAFFVPFPCLRSMQVWLQSPNPCRSGGWLGSFASLTVARSGFSGRTVSWKFCSHFSCAVFAS